MTRSGRALLIKRLASIARGNFGPTLNLGSSSAALSCLGLGFIFRGDDLGGELPRLVVVLSLESGVTAFDAEGVANVGQGVVSGVDGRAAGEILENDIGGSNSSVKGRPRKVKPCGQRAIALC